MILNQPWTALSKPGSGRKPTNTHRRTLIGGAIGGAMVALLSPTARVMAEGTAVPNDPFILLLKGIYQPVVHGPDLGLSAVNLNDGSYSRTKIHSVFGIPGGANHNNREDNAIGNFYVQFNGSLAAYQIPGGALAMRFTGGGFSSIPHPDGQGGQFLEGTFELTVLQATGIYRAFQRGHNHMVDKLHKLADADSTNSASALSASISSHKTEAPVSHATRAETVASPVRGDRTLALWINAPPTARATAE